MFESVRDFRGILAAGLSQVGPASASTADLGCGVRQAGRLCKVNRGTVGRLSRVAGSHARDLHEELVAFSPEHPRGPVR